MGPNMRLLFIDSLPKALDITVDSSRCPSEAARSDWQANVLIGTNRPLSQAVHCDCRSPFSSSRCTQVNRWSRNPSILTESKSKAWASQHKFSTLAGDVFGTTTRHLPRVAPTRSHSRPSRPRKSHNLVHRRACSAIDALAPSGARSPAAVRVPLLRFKPGLKKARE